MDRFGRGAGSGFLGARDVLYFAIDSRKNYVHYSRDSLLLGILDFSGPVEVL